MVARFFRLVKRQIDVQLRVRTFNLFNLLLLFFQPAIFSGVGILLSRAAGNETPDLVYTIIGGGVMGMWSGLVFTSTFDIRADRRDGVLELIVGSTTSLGVVEAIRTFANVIAGLVSMLTAVLIAVLFFKYTLNDSNIPGFLFSLLLLLIGMWCIGVFLSNFLVWSRLSGSLVDLLEAPVAVLCGFMYPVDILPHWMQAISTIFPIRWALEAMNASLLGTHDSSLLWSFWGLSLGISFIFWSLSLWLERKVHDLIRVTGELNSI